MHLRQILNNLFLRAKIKKYKSLNLYLTIFSVILNSLFISGNVNASTDLEIIGNISKGTCTISAPTQDVIFKKNIITHELKEDVGDKSFTTPFTFKYHCQDFEISEPLQMLAIKITPSNGTTINSNNIIYPTTNTVNAGFILRSCDSNKKNCHPLLFSPHANVPFEVVSNGELESQFEVSVVKIDSNPAKAGELIASVDLTLIQP
ncbi:fimbrial protein [Proteus sp. ZN5]|uniref:fimbrial protein n=1 Tax=Proteus sp. ZN5 TaxID=2697019 RepID=UPI0013E10D99|nr:fimbrial protein [Proteus sp. ZN5]QIG04342.1 fimbrial protein [Proteus sp. ZN5]